jgi:hypothetical protein
LFAAFSWAAASSKTFAEREKEQDGSVSSRRPSRLESSPSAPLDRAFLGLLACDLLTFLSVLQ